MRSLIIIEVEHGEDTDEFCAFAESLSEDNRYSYPGLSFQDYTVRVDLPQCFTLDKGE